MAAPLWKTYAVRPLGFGGIGTFLSWIAPGSDDPADVILEARAKVGAAFTLDANDPALATVDLVLGKNVETYRQGLRTGPINVSWFARTASGWIAGPQTVADLSSSWTSYFNYAKDWAVRTLQALERDSQPLGSDAQLAIRGAYPRDSFPVPCLSVSFEASPLGTSFIGDLARARTPQTNQEMKGWNVSLGVILWASSPEERDELAPWLLRCSQALLHLAPYNDINEPSMSISEAEDFSGSKAEMPLFFTSCTISGTMWSSLTVPVHNPQGHFTV